MNNVLVKEQGFHFELSDFTPKLNIAFKQNGATRNVLLIGKYAVKIPKFGSGFHKILYGFASNLNEKRWYKMVKSDKDMMSNPEIFCPIIGSLPFGLMAIMPRAEPYTSSNLPDSPKTKFGTMRMDIRPDNLGTLEGRTVIIDYGGNMYCEGYGFGKDGPYMCSSHGQGEPTGGWD